MSDKLLYCRECGDEIHDPTDIEIRLFLSTHAKHDAIKVGITSKDIDDMDSDNEANAGATIPK